MNPSESDILCRADHPASSDVAVGDLFVLHSAVTARLRLLVRDDFLAGGAQRGEDAPTRIRNGVLECVAALDQLHWTLAHEVARRQLLEIAAREAQAVLARAQLALPGTLADERRGRDLTLLGDLAALPDSAFARD
jgi:hypothetical protein